MSRTYVASFVSFAGLLLIGLAVSASGCASAAPSADAAATAQPEKSIERATASTLKPLPQKKFGADITEKANTPLTSLLHEPAKYQSKTVRTEGVVSAVCKAMGCWMEIAEPSGQAHIKMAGHRFFVPKDASGHRAVVQGVVLPSSNDECSEEAKQQTGVVAKVEIEATGVEFVD